ncbi:hypothetical protein HK104_001065 [Borealophlyctis nickersoniae]|nr:hypothetical protein HK104_001065 [Borealophlyctis nickersoniae]
MASFRSMVSQYAWSQQKPKQHTASTCIRTSARLAAKRSRTDTDDNDDDDHDNYTYTSQQPQVQHQQRHTLTTKPFLKRSRKLVLSKTTNQLPPPPPTATTQSLKEIPDHLAHDLDVIFCGFNPGVKSSTTGHHYAGGNNHFWPCLSGSGLVKEVLTYKGIREDDDDDARCIPDYSIGFTNLVSRPTPSSSNLTQKDLTAGVAPLLAKLTLYTPRVCCFVGMDVYRVFKGLKVGTVKCGLQTQPMRWEGGKVTWLFVVPSTSGRVSAYSRRDYERMFAELGRVVVRLKRGESPQGGGKKGDAVEKRVGEEGTGRGGEDGNSDDGTEARVGGHKEGDGKNETV